MKGLVDMIPNINPQDEEIQKVLNQQGEDNKKEGDKNNDKNNDNNNNNNDK